MLAIPATAAAFVVSRRLTFLNRWDFLPIQFNDAFLSVAQDVTVAGVLALTGNLNLTHLMVGMALADISMAVAVLVDRMIVAASVWPSQPARRR